MKKVAVVLSGCGFKDGSEITEAVSTLIALSQQGASYQCFAPDFTIDATDHLTGEEVIGDQRNIRTEAARIARGNVKDLSTLKSQDFDAIIFPGGYGAALQLCSWAQKGALCEVLPDVRKILTDFHAQSKPIGAICIAPVLVAKVLGSHGVTVTIGNDKETAAEIKKTGAQHVDCPVDDYITDRLTKVVSTPAYMYDAQPHQVLKGISGLVKEIVEMA
ncbi:MAG: isoprenoid biosynthesis glyoxalase ElbB [Pseudobdellovibrionaceae bacterium]